MPPTRTAEHGSTKLYQRGCRCDTCRTNHAARRRAWKIRTGRLVVGADGRPLPREPQLPAAPLLEAVYAFLGRQERGVTSLGDSAAQTIWRAAKSGTITAGIADRLAVTVLGRHPAEVYGWEWYALEITDDA